MTYKNVKRSVMIAGHATSISLEEPFWDELKALADKNNQSINQIISDIDAQAKATNLSSAVRIYILENLKASV